MAYHMTKPYNSYIQIWAMRSRYPQFKAKRKSEFEIEFTGELHVKPELPVYMVSITYRGDNDPHVKIISPAQCFGVCGYFGVLGRSKSVC